MSAVAVAVAEVKAILQPCLAVAVVVVKAMDKAVGKAEDKAVVKTETVSGSAGSLKSVHLVGMETNVAIPMTHLFSPLEVVSVLDPAHTSLPFGRGQRCGPSSYN
eukprot:gene31199-6346_t